MTQRCLYQVFFIYLDTPGGVLFCQPYAHDAYIDRMLEDCPVQMVCLVSTLPERIRIQDIASVLQDLAGDLIFINAVFTHHSVPSQTVLPFVFVDKLQCKNRQQRENADKYRKMQPVF